MNNIITLFNIALVTVVATIVGGVAVFYLTSDSFNTVDARIQYITLESADYSPSFKMNELKKLMIRKGFPVYKPDSSDYSSNVSIIALRFTNNTDNKILSIEIIAPDVAFAFDDSNSDNLLQVTGNGLLKIGDLSIDQEKRIILGFGYNNYSNWFDRIKIVADNKRVYPRLDSVFGFFSTNFGMIVLTLGLIGLFPAAFIIIIIPLGLLLHFKPEWQFKAMSEKEKDKALLVAKKVIVERRNKTTEITDGTSQEILDSEPK